MKVILDCNIWISFLLGYQKQLVYSILNNPQIDVYICHDLIDEIMNVTQREKIRKHIQLDDVEDLLNIMQSYCVMVDDVKHVDAYIRDAKDLCLLSLSEAINADYLISGDADLTSLSKHKNTKIVKLAEFRNEL